MAKKLLPSREQINKIRRRLEAYNKDPVFLTADMGHLEIARAVVGAAFSYRRVIDLRDESAEITQEETEAALEVLQMLKDGELDDGVLFYEDGAPVYSDEKGCNS